MKNFISKIIAFFKAADKQLHILAEFAIALTVFVFFASFSLNWLGFALGIIIAAVAGGLKEWHDYKHPEKGDFEIADIVADCFGILAAVGVMLFYLLN